LPFRPAFFIITAKFKKLRGFLFSMELWLFFPIGYLLTISIETPILLAGLPKPVSLKQRLFCGLWLTACSYPIVVLVLPNLITESRFYYLLVAETFAPVAECFLFWLAFRWSIKFGKIKWIQSFATIVLANLASFGIGEILNAYRWYGLF
jgi:hypothetical protein